MVQRITVWWEEVLSQGAKNEQGRNTQPEVRSSWREAEAGREEGWSTGKSILEALIIPLGDDFSKSLATYLSRIETGNTFRRKL